MKSSLSIFLLVNALGALAHGGHVCGIIPEHLLRNITQHQGFDADTRASANATLHHLHSIRNSQQDDGNRNGIISSGDDDEFDDEQDPEYATDMAEEAAALEVSDADPADPDSEPPEQPSPATPSQASRVRRRTGTFRARQAANANRFVYKNDMSCDAKPPKQLVRTEGTPVARDSSINSIFDKFGVVFNFYQTQYRRNSFDGRGGKLHGTAHYCNSYQNAVWDGVQMLFGDGDGRIFGDFTSHLDIVGHELTHGVVQSVGGLQYVAQTGALNEHLADVFGVLSKQFNLTQTAAQADWLIGASLIKLQGARALRDMKNPGTAYNSVGIGKDMQVGDFRDYFRGSFDNYGVHLNSGIPNRAFFLAATAIGGYAYDVPGKVWYSVMSSGTLSYNQETFRSFAEKTVSTGRTMYNASVASLITQAWQTVHVL